jgi:hypothetical protein
MARVAPHRHRVLQTVESVLAASGLKGKFRCGEVQPVDQSQGAGSWRHASNATRGLSRTFSSERASALPTLESSS